MPRGPGLAAAHEPAAHAGVHHRAGDATKAMAAFGEDNDAGELWAGTRYRVGTDSYMLGFHGFGRMWTSASPLRRSSSASPTTSFLELDCTPQPTRAGRRGLSGDDRGAGGRVQNHGSKDGE